MAVRPEGERLRDLMKSSAPAALVSNLIFPLRLRSGRIGANSFFSAALYVADVVESSTDEARQAGASLGKKPRLAAKVAAPPSCLSPNGCRGTKSRIARLGKQREEVR